MTVNEYRNLPIIDDNERVLILTSDINHRELYRGLACDIPSTLLDEELWTVGALSEAYIAKYRLDRYGWTGLFLEMSDDN